MSPQLFFNQTCAIHFHTLQRALPPSTLWQQKWQRADDTQALRHLGRRAPAARCPPCLGAFPRRFPVVSQARPRQMCKTLFSILLVRKLKCSKKARTAITYCPPPTCQPALCGLQDTDETPILSKAFFHPSKVLPPRSSTYFSCSSLMMCGWLFMVPRTRVFVHHAPPPSGLHAPWITWKDSPPNLHPQQQSGQGFSVNNLLG